MVYINDMKSDNTVDDVRLVQMTQTMKYPAYCTEMFHLISYFYVSKNAEKMKYGLGGSRCRGLVEIHCASCSFQTSLSFVSR